eukprot:s4724_g2.t1
MNSDSTWSDNQHGRIEAALQGSSARQAELLDDILARVDVGGDDADGCKHGHAAVVELTAAHLKRVLVQAAARSGDAV